MSASAFQPDVVVVGAGPAGLAAADTIGRQGGSVAIVERSHVIGGLARSAEIAGYVVDPGGHRLLAATRTQRDAWLALASRIGPIRLNSVTRRTGILRHGYLFTYPVDWAQIRQAAPWRVRAMGAASAVKSRIFPIQPEVSLADWVRNRYGAYLSQRFMDPHARKVFGVEPQEIPSTWAAQRIADPPLRSIVGTVLPRVRKPRRPPEQGGDFFYLDGGIGVLWSQFAKSLRPNTTFFFDSEVTEIVEPTARHPGRVRLSGPGGVTEIGCPRIIWTGRPEDLARLVGAPALEADIADGSTRRDLVIGLVQVHSMPSQWEGFQCLYTHDRGVQAHRFQNYGEWQGLQVPRGLIGMEYAVPSGCDADMRSAVRNDLSILGVEDFDILGFDVLRDAYSNFDLIRPLFQKLEEILQDFPVPIISTGRQGAGIYVNIDQALKLGERAAMMADHRGVLGNGQYTPYQEARDRR